MAGPIIILFSAALFLAFCIIQTASKGMQAWKTDPLPGVLWGIDADTKARMLEDLQNKLLIAQERGSQLGQTQALDEVSKITKVELERSKNIGMQLGDYYYGRGGQSLAAALYDSPRCEGDRQGAQSTGWKVG